jgi:hypothetical protein
VAKASLLMAAKEGATSLVDLILKKFGDDTDGAAKELERLGGFPPEVSQRIASGDLPMDAASVEARRIAQGYGDELYHGSTHDIKEFNGQGNPSNDWGQGTYLTDSAHDATRNYAGTHGEDFKARVYEEKEILENAYDRGTRPDLSDGDGSFDTDKGTAAARRNLQGGNEGVIYPVRVKQDGLFNISDEIPRPDYTEMAQEEMGIPGKKWVDQTEEERERVWELADEFQADDPDSPAMSLFEMGQEYGVRPEDIPHPDDVVSWNGLRHELREVYGEDDLGNPVTSGTMVGDVMQRQGAKGVSDWTTTDRFDSMESGNHTIMFPGSENQIRSVNAAFDPQYTGSNIMGGATVPLLGATALGTAGALAAPALMKVGVFQHSATKEPVVERREAVNNQSSLLEGVTDFADDVFASFKDAAGPIGSLLMPFEGVNDYLKVVNDNDKQPTWWDRLGLLDL